MTETEAYQAVTETPAKCEIRNHAGSKKWYTVGYFTAEPRENPKTAKENFVECARFIGQGDAHMYANMLARRPNSQWFWAVVIR